MGEVTGGVSELEVCKRRGNVVLTILLPSECHYGLRFCIVYHSCLGSCGIFKGRTFMTAFKPGIAPLRHIEDEAIPPAPLSGLTSTIIQN